MNIDLPVDAVKFIESLVDSGEYETAEAALADGVRLLMARKKLKDDIQLGIDDLDAGRWTDGDEVFAELRDRASRMDDQES